MQYSCSISGGTDRFFLSAHRENIALPGHCFNNISAVLKGRHVIFFVVGSYMYGLRVCEEGRKVSYLMRARRRKNNEERIVPGSPFLSFHATQPCASVEHQHAQWQVSLFHLLSHPLLILFSLFHLLSHHLSHPLPLYLYHLFSFTDF